MCTTFLREQLAHFLREQRGVRHSHIVGVWLRRGFSLVVAHLAVMKTGAAYLLIDPAYPRDRVEYMINDAQVCYFEEGGVVL